MIHMQPPAVWLNSHSPLSHRWGRGITIHVIHGAKHIHAQCISLHVHVFVYRGTINPSHVKVYIYMYHIYTFFEVFWSFLTLLCAILNDRTRFLGISSGLPCSQALVEGIGWWSPALVEFDSHKTWWRSSGHHENSMPFDSFDLGKNGKSSRKQYLGDIDNIGYYQTWPRFTVANLKRLPFL